MLNYLISRFGDHYLNDPSCSNNSIPILEGIPVPGNESTISKLVNVSTIYVEDNSAFSPVIENFLTKINNLLINTKYDYCGGIVFSDYIELLQQEVNNTPAELLAGKLSAIYEYELLGLLNYYKLIGCKNPIELLNIYLNYCNEKQHLFVHNLISSPLEQFSILPLIPMNIGNLYFSFTNSSLFMLLTLSLVLLLLHFVTKKGGGNSVPNAWQSLVELIYDFVLNPVNEQIGGLSGNVKQKFSPRISVTFTFSLFRNLQGMIPYSFTVTSHFLITLGLSFSIFIGITIVGFQRNGLHFLSFLLPAGVPLPLAPFLVLLELISHCFRALSSGIRLFANMMAGHSSVKILSGSAWTMLCMNDLFYFIGDPGPLFIVLALTGLELGVAISQAHVSTILICIYLNDATNLHQSAYLFIIEQKRV